ncbi:MAG: aminotransferase class I/II-fold pyridoxal phosphate-dependent enzyme [Planctomycetota bacterium]|jgi:dTDP-4-amino-4,6-dideoxygalactose transaminase|nr:aminotransferase class I/II-fold pyridoxal phosphate-dependent enzyme [Planctomycetota bacterium]
MELAIFGGKPVFSETQPVGLPLVENDTIERYHRLLDKVFQVNFLTNDGPLLRRLEEALSERFRVKQAVVVTNATLAQMLIMRAEGINSGRVIIPTNTFISTAHVCEWVGAVPVFADIDPLTLNLDPLEIRRLAVPDLVAVMPTHVFGVMANLPTIIEEAKKLKLRVICDAAHAFDCDAGGSGPGGCGVPEFLSFHATKFFSTFEGGAILTNDPDLAREMRELRNFGFAGIDDVSALGINAKMTEAAAAFGLASLPALEARRERLRLVHAAYQQSLAGIQGVRLHDFSQGKNNHRYFPIFIEDSFGASRDAVCQALWQENILVRRYFYPGCHRMRYYARKTPGGPIPLPQADKVLGKILCLPTSFAELPDLEGVKRLSDCLARLQKAAPAVEKYWREYSGEVNLENTEESH